jgi:hypothetical protein
MDYIYLVVKNIIIRNIMKILVGISINLLTNINKDVNINFQEKSKNVLWKKFF